MAEEQKSTILSDEQLNNVVEGKEINENLGEEIVLESDKKEEEAIPEKYAGKSAEEVYRLMKIENDYKNNQEQENTEDNQTQENNNTEEVPADIVKEYTQKLIDNGGDFTEEDYTKLAEKGYTKDFVDNYKAGVEQKQKEDIKNTFIEASTTQEDFQKAGEWARQNWDETRINEFNEAMNEAYSSNNKAIQKSLIRSLTDSFNTAPKKAQTFHGKSVAETTVNGYKTKSDYIKDANDIRYKKDASYRKIVEQKFLKTDRNNW